MALNALGMAALSQQDGEGAARYFRRAATADPTAPELWMNAAKGYRIAGDPTGEREALQQALAIDQRHFMALVRMAEWHERAGQMPDAATRWAQVLALGAQIDEPAPALQQILGHAQSAVERQHGQLAEGIERALSGKLSSLLPRDRRRFDACVDHALGRRRIYSNICTGMHFPFLPAEEFFEREHFPWLEEIEAQTDVIRSELLAILADRDEQFRPYIDLPAGTPDNKWSSLNHSLAWGALHLWKDGQRDDDICRRAPRTAAAVEALPLSDLPGRTPTVFFSILRPGTHLPAHTGVSNLRSIVHLPLIVPEGCRFRVGGDTRSWEVGRAWVFDDTIDHEAWNTSDELRAILIFDVWNPYITPIERDLLRSFYDATVSMGEGSNALIAVGE